jgi:aspartate ammonia-lyase
MADNNVPADAYYGEDTGSAKEDFDLSFLDDETAE